MLLLHFAHFCLPMSSFQNPSQQPANNSHSFENQQTEPLETDFSSDTHFYGPPPYSPSPLSSRSTARHFKRRPPVPESDIITIDDDVSAVVFLVLVHGCVHRNHQMDSRMH